MSDKWDKRWMGLAIHISQWSGDTSTKVGAVLADEQNNLISIGWNDLCRGIKDLPERRERPVKYSYTAHAEENLIYNVSGRSGQVGECRMYCTLFPCSGCARAIIQATNLNIKTIIVPKPEFGSEMDERFGWTVTHQMLMEAGVRIRYAS